MSYPTTSSHFAGSFDIRAMVKETVRKGVDIDRPVIGSTTLLHLAIQNDLLDCVVKLLSSGADANLPNEDGATARDIALDNGNQIVLQVLSRREEYTMHLQLFNRCTDISMSTGSSMDHFSALASIDSDVCTTDLKMVPLTIGAVYEDYFDWTDSQRCNHLQKLVDSLRNEEFDLKRTLEALDTRRIRNSGRLCELHTSLRDREHHLCLEVWAAIQAERHSRRALETASADVVHVKDLLSQALEYVHYRGVVRAAPYKKVFFNSWHRSNVEITGLALIVEPLNKCLEECSTKDYFKKSFSMSFQSSKTPKSSSKTLSKYTKDNSEGTHYSTYDTNHPGGSEAEDADGETDGSSGATSYARDAMMAAHALGRDGLPESTCGGKNKPFISYSTGPVRRKLQKLHESGVQRRIIPVQDIIAVEVSKIDKSLGPCYVQVELRIHYFKEGQQRLTAHSLLFSPQQSATSRVSVIGADGTTTETRERLMSSSSTASANGSIRSTSTNSASGAASTLAAGVVAGAGAGVLASPHRPLGMKTQGSASKTRSISTGGASLGFESFSASTKNTSAGGGATSTATVSSAAAAQVPAIASIPPEKLDTVWFKLPMQSNTISRSVATGKSRSKTAGLDDGTEGPTLTFELFVAILRRVRDGIKIFSCSSNGVETLYRVNPAFGDVPPSKSSSTSTAAAVATSESAMATEIASPSPGMHRKVSSSGNLCGELGAGVYSQPLATASPQRTHGKSAASLRSGDKSEDTYGYGGDLRSYSPKRSTSSTSTAAARLSSSCNSTSSSSYPTSSYQGGSMNSASGLTSIESLVGITSLRGNGSSRTSLSASTSTSASMSSSSTSYNTASSLSMKGGSSNSPRFEYKYLGDDTVQEETTADLQDMNDDDDEGAFSDFSMPRVVSQQALNDEQDDDDKEAPRRFLKLTRRATEGDQALSKGPSFHAGSSSSSAAAQYLDGESEDIRGASFSSFRVDLSDPGMCGSALLVEDCDYDVATTRHTISSDTIPAQMNSTSRNSSSRHLLASVAAGAAATSGAAQGSAPGSPRHRNSFSCDTAVATTVAAHSSKENLLDNVDSQKCFSAPIVPLRRTDSRTSVEARNSAFAAQSAKRGTADTNTSTCAGLSKKHGSSATMAPEDMIRYPAKLARLLEKTRSKRSKIQSRLEELLNSKEKMRESVQYLQSLMAIVDNPPPTPTRSLAKTKAPSIDKAMLLLSVYGDHINQVTDGYTTSTTTSTGSSASKPLGVSGSVGYSSMSGLGSNLSSGLGMAHTSEYRGKLNDAEEFVRVMLQVNASTALTTTAFTTTTTATADSRSQSYATDLRESFSSTTSSSRASHSNNINRLHPANGGPVVRRLFAEEASQQQQQQRSYGHSVGSTSSSGHGIHTTTSAASVTSHATSHGAASGGTSGGTAGASTGSRSYVVSRSSFAPSPTNANINSGTGEDAAPQLLRSPPPEFKPDFDAVMSQLEDIWNCELETFQTVERLAQCLALRGQTWQRLKLLREQEQSMAAPVKEDLYDIEF